MTQGRVIEIVTFTTLFPNSIQSNHGVFVENRLRHLVADGRVASRVVAPVPWFPFSSDVFGRYALYAKVPREEVRSGLRINHPRYAVVPKLTMKLTPHSLFRAALPVLERLRKARDFDLIDAHYFYPDGVAAAWLGRALGKPVVITARGTDVNLIPKFAAPRRMIVAAADSAAGIIAVSRALQDCIVDLGIPKERVTVLRNGVDLALFHPGVRTASVDAATARSRSILLSVGQLIERKGHDLVIGALPLLPQCSLLIAGEGPERTRLEHLAERLDVADRVRFLGSVVHHDLPAIYANADVLVLASSREGWPNVLLEAMACGTPVVASPVFGNPEVVTQPEAGVLMRDRTPEGVAEAVQRLLRQYPERGATRRYAEHFSWDQTTEGQLQLFERILNIRARARTADRAYA
jgi:teichuronic acid biosynthesis glycosyltransferase TuaC